jgi:hypothetical protein
MRCPAYSSVVLCIRPYFNGISARRCYGSFEIRILPSYARFEAVASMLHERVRQSAPAPRSGLDRATRRDV